MARRIYPDPPLEVVPEVKLNAPLTPRVPAFNVFTITASRAAVVGLAETAEPGATILRLCSSLGILHPHVALKGQLMHLLLEDADAVKELLS